MKGGNRPKGIKSTIFLVLKLLQHAQISFYAQKYLHMQLENEWDCGCLYATKNIYIQLEETQMRNNFDWHPMQGMQKEYIGNASRSW